MAAERFDTATSGVASAAGTCTLRVDNPQPFRTVAISSVDISVDSSTASPAPTCVIYRNAAVPANRLASSRSADADTAEGDGADTLRSGEYLTIVFSGVTTGETCRAVVHGTVVAG